MKPANSQSKINRQFNYNFVFNSRAVFFCLLFLISLSTVSNVSAQANSSEEIIVQKDSQEKTAVAEVPPPLKILAKEEKASLAAQTDVKKRTLLTLDLMDARLLKAETFKSKEEYQQMFEALGGFHALMDDTLDYLKRNNTGSGKVLNNFKRIEISLRKDITRLELIRRDLPAAYDPYVRSLVKLVREARSRAVEPLFGNTVLNDNE